MVLAFSKSALRITEIRSCKLSFSLLSIAISLVKLSSRIRESSMLLVRTLRYLSSVFAFATRIAFSFSKSVKKGKINQNQNVRCQNV